MSKSDNKNNKKAAEKAPSAVSETSGVILFGKKISYQNLTLIITAAVLSVLFIVGMVFVIINEVQKNEDKNFDYLTSDLSTYISMNEDLYKNYKISLDIAKPRKVDVDSVMLSLLADKKGGVKYEGRKQSSGKIDAGDEVYIYYRGYLLDEDGNEEPLDKCNFGSKDSAGDYTPALLEIGSNGFYPGLEVSLVGKNFTSANNFVRITTGDVKAGQILYISYTKTLDGSTATSDKTTAVAERVVLADGEEKIDAKYGDGFYEKLFRLPVGVSTGNEFVGTVGGKTYKYTDIKIDFATECEKEGTYFLVDCYFPYNYDNDALKNRDARFEVYIQGIVEYEEVALTDEFVDSLIADGTLGLTSDDLADYEGTSSEKIVKYLEDSMEKEYQKIYKEQLEEAILNHYLNENVTTIKRYPKTKVDNVYNEYFDDVVAQFEASGGVIQNALGQSKTCKTLDEYAVIYLGLEYSGSNDWRAHLRNIAQMLVKQRLIVFYLMDKENINPTQEELLSQIEQSKKEHVDVYIAQYLAKNELDKKDYSDEEWAEFEADRSAELFAVYDDSYFTERAYYEIALKTMSTWPEITTLDDITVSKK